LWRAVAVYRIVTLAFASALIIGSERHYAHPAGGYIALAVLAAWTVVTVVAYSRPAGRNRWLVGADVLVAGALIVSTRWIDTAPRIAHGAATIPTIWAVSAILACAVWGGPWAGMAGALPVWIADLIEKRTLPTQSTLDGLVLLMVAGGVSGYVARVTRLAEAATDGAARREAGAAERLARGMHDSVLQVLALVSSRGRELGGPAAELGELAAQQEAALRLLVSGDILVPDSGTGLMDVRALIEPLADARITVSGPATAVLLPPDSARALGTAAAAAVDNVRRHAGEGARGWVLVEDDGSNVRVSVRDDGAGFGPGRLAVAAAAGRLGVSQSMAGGLREVGGSAIVTSRPGEGTEVDLRVPRSADNHLDRRPRGLRYPLARRPSVHETGR
jgi:signal transduction histidine kinase